LVKNKIRPKESSDQIGGTGKRANEGTSIRGVLRLKKKLPRREKKERFGVLTRTGRERIQVPEKRGTIRPNCSDLGLCGGKKG